MLKSEHHVKATYYCCDTQLRIFTTYILIIPDFTNMHINMQHTLSCSSAPPATAPCAAPLSFALSLYPPPTAALTHYQRDGPVLPVDLQPAGDQFLPMAPAAGLRRRRRRRLRLVVLPQVIKRPQDPRNGQNRDGVGPYPAHGEPIWRAPEASPAGSGPSAAEGAASPPVMV